MKSTEQTRVEQGNNMTQYRLVLVLDFLRVGVTMGRKGRGYMLCM